jgi:predicted ester cyclase
MANSPADLVRRFYDELWNAANEAVAAEILDPDFAFRGSLGPESRGIPPFLAYLRAIHAALGGYRCTIGTLIIENEQAAARMTFAGRHRGMLLGVPATGRDVAWQGTAFFDIAASRIAGLWVLGDLDALRAQLTNG